MNHTWYPKNTSKSYNSTSDRVPNKITHSQKNNSFHTEMFVHTRKSYVIWKITFETLEHHMYIFYWNVYSSSSRWISVICKSQNAYINLISVRSLQSNLKCLKTNFQMPFLFNRVSQLNWLTLLRNVLMKYFDNCRILWRK